jgi:hypothetical protein
MMNKVSIAETVINKNVINDKGVGFKNILDKKMVAKKDLTISKPENWQQLLSDAMTNHDKITKAVKTSLQKTNFTPDQLLKVQFKTSLFLLKEQFFCKTVEQTASAMKNFAQMQV